MAELEPAAAPAGALTCPWCGSADVAEIAQYGSLLMTAQWFCDGCGSAFERIRHRGSDTEPAPAATDADGRSVAEPETQPIAAPDVGAPIEADPPDG